MGGDAAVDEIVNGERSQAPAIELSEQVLEPAVTEGGAVRVLRVDHPIGIPDDEIAGLQRAALNARGCGERAAERIAAADQRVQLDTPPRDRASQIARFFSGAAQVRGGVTARHETDLTVARIEDRGEAGHGERAAADAPHGGIEGGD